MTEEQKQALIADCKEEIESIRWRMDRTVATMGSTAYLESCLKRQQIALASLTAHAADLAQLVPDDAPEKVRYEMEMATGLILDEDDSQALWCLCRDAILRKIEEAK